MQPEPGTIFGLSFLDSDGNGVCFLTRLSLPQNGVCAQRCAGARGGALLAAPCCERGDSGQGDGRMVTRWDGSLMMFKTSGERKMQRAFFTSVVFVSLGCVVLVVAGLIS